MTRLGWAILMVIILGVAAFASMTSFGTADRSGVKTVAAVPPVATTGLLTIPVAGVPRSAIVESWGDARGGGTRGHHGTDIMAPGGTPVVAAAAGRIEKLFQSELGGTTLYIRSQDGGWVHYYAHLAGYVPGLAEGQAVRAGQQIAYVGDTGDAGPSNFHLHFGMQRMHPGERWWQGEDVDPYPFLTGRGVAGTAAPR